MQKTILYTVFAVLFITAACKKNNDVPATGPDEALQQKAITWLDKQQTNQSDRCKNVITGIKNNLQWKKAWQAVHNNSGHLLIVPLAGSDMFKNNKGKAVSSYVVFFMTDAYEFTGAKIFQSHTGSKFTPASIPSIYNFEPKDLHGTYTVLGLFDIFYSDDTYENDRLAKTRTMQTRPKTGTGRTANSCVDWFLVTTHYDPFTGIILSQTEIWIGNSCAGCVPVTNEPQTEITAQQEWECWAGTGGSAEEEEPDAVKTVQWNVIQKPGHPNGGHVVSMETLRGKRRASEQQGGHFKSIVHYATTCNFCNSSLNPNDNWFEYSSQTSIITPQLAQIRITGRLIFEGTSTYPNETKEFAFKDVF